MQYIIGVIFYICFLTSAVSQEKAHIGQLNFFKCKIVKRDTAFEDICGISTKVVRVTVRAKTRCQLSCDMGNPKNNIYRTVINKLVVCYQYDSTDILNRAILKEIELKNDYWNTIVRYDSTDTEYGNSHFDRSFFVNKKQFIPFVSTVGEKEGDYQIFYINKGVYKIILVEGNGMGSISSFREQNILFKPYAIYSPHNLRR
jgi:hypothetical protein